MIKVKKIRTTPPVGSKIKKPNPKLLKRAAWKLLSFAAGFLLSNACVVGNIRPFGIAPVCALPMNVEIWAAFGAALGALVFCDILGALKYISAVVMITLLRIIAQRHFECEKTSLPQALCAMASLFISSLSIEAARGMTFSGFILCICESILCGGGAFLLHNLVYLQKSGYGKTGERKTNVCILTTCGLAVLSLMSFRPGGFPVAPVLLAFVILLWSYHAGETGGCLAGVCCGCIAGLADDGAYTVVSSGIGGLMAGLCIPAGRPAAVTAYFVSCLLTMVVNGVTGNPVLYACAALSGGLLFLLIPRKVLKKAAPFVGEYDKTMLAESTRALLKQRLQKTEEAIFGFASTAGEVGERIAKIKAPREQEICHYVRSVCCANCPRQSLCWDNSLAGLRPSFLQARQRIRQDGILTAKTLPDRLTQVCRNSEALVNAYNEAYARFLQRSAQNKEILAVKKLAGAQLRTAGVVLEDLLQNNMNGLPVPGLTQNVFDILQKESVAFDTVQVEQNHEKRIFIHITFSYRPTRSQLQKIGIVLAHKLDIPISAPVRGDSKGLHYCYCEAPAFSVQCESRQHIGGNEKICGDSLTCFRDTFGRFIAILSDGMGTGERAALDSLMTGSLAETLLKANLSVQCTAKLINSALLLRTSQETVATLDIAIVDLYTGKVQIYKAGASFSVLHSKGKTAVLEQQSLPLGILDNVDLACCEFTMKDGDSLYMLSDGAGHVDIDFFKEVSNASGLSLSDIPEQIIRHAITHTEQKTADDITCLVLHLEKIKSAAPTPPVAKSQKPTKELLPLK